MASSSTSASTSHGNRVFDVFLNHRGPDAKKTLASHIYHRLTDCGLRVFFDTAEMQPGEDLSAEIKDAIRTASVHVAIFTKDYASSPWCLDELVEMLDTKKTIIPIFYDVDPSELRWTQAGYGVYARALRMLDKKTKLDPQTNKETPRDGVYARALNIIRCILQCKWGEDRGYVRALRMPRYESKTIENWRRALSYVAEISGFELKKFNRDEGLLVNGVIQRVLKTLPKTLPNVAMYPTGLDVKVKELEAIVSSQQQSGSLARAVGIVGLGGLGTSSIPLPVEGFEHLQSHFSVPMASSSTSASTSNGNRVYDVFLNHRGPDAKKTLASHIYHRLTDRGLRVFFDTEEMQPGEELTAQIIDAIRTASVHVAIFSEGYASSPWCLNELVLMVDTNKTIIPIFYDVNPSELRWTQAGNGRYARDLHMLERRTTTDPQTNKEAQRYGSDTIEKWRTALSYAAEISGFELNKFNRDEGLLVNEVIQRVLKTVPKTLPNVAMYPTGLDLKVKEVEAIVSSQQQSGSLARAVGIVGLGGVGKTTLAKQFFNSHTSNFGRSCFLSDVREKAGRNPLNSLQYQLLKDLAGYNEQINSPDEGIEMLRRYLPSSCRALICIDDVDHLDQLSALFFPVKHTNSLILITSRNKDVLRSAEIEESSIYMVKGLNTQDSQKLFCWHAFKQPYPVEGFEQLVEKFLDACDGLPLSLKVIGALLYGKRNFNFWKEQLAKISKILPAEIQSRLKISFDGLDEEEKGIFLDIACFFIGIDRDTAIRIWDGSGWQGWLGLSNLENRCLVEVDSENCITMHDHLRDLGRYLAKKEYPALRLWRMEDNLHNRPNHSSVRGIDMVYRNDAEQFFENLADSCNMSRLQLLRAEGDFVERLFNVNGHFRHLIYLHWDNCPYSSLPPSIPIKNLRVLYIEGESLETLWQEESQAPLEMREMVIHAKLKMIPKSIGKLQHLEKIDLSSEYLESLPDSVGNLENLKSLHLCRCSGLQMLPDSVGNMTNLQSLDLDWCSALQMLPDSVGNMTNLQSLNLRDCSSLEMLPDSVGNMTNLQSLNLRDCSSLEMLPDSVGNMTNLQSLNLRDCSSLEMLPDSVGNMTKLQRLGLRRCSALQMLPDSVGNMTNLQSLDLGSCSALQMLPDSVGNMTNLQRLNLRRCSALQMLPDSVGNMTNLQSLDLDWCSALQMLPDSVGNMTNLQSLDLGWCSALQMVPDSVGNMTNLQSLDLYGCSALKKPPIVEHLSSLRYLNVLECPKLQWGAGVVEQLSQRGWIRFVH